MKKSRKTIAGASALAIIGAFCVAAPAIATPPGGPPGPPEKVFVCKIVGAPGAYFLAPGKNPIHVSVNSTDAEEAFSDAHPSYIVDSEDVACVAPVNDPEDPPDDDPEVDPFLVNATVTGSCTWVAEVETRTYGVSWTGNEDDALYAIFEQAEGGVPVETGALLGLEGSIPDWWVTTAPTIWYTIGDSEERVSVTAASCTTPEDPDDPDDPEDPATPPKPTQG